MKISCLFASLGILCLLCVAPSRVARARMPAQEQTQSTDKKKITDIDVGENITAEDAKILEDSLINNPDSLYVHSKLIHYYFEAGISSRSSEFEAKREQHVLWLIEHHPEASLAGSPEAGMDILGDQNGKDAFQRAKALWMQQIERHPDDLKVLHNAGEFLSLSDSKAALEVLQKAVDIDPNNPDTLELLARTYEHERILAKPPEEKTALAVKALELRERELEKVEEPLRSFALVQTTHDAYDAGDMAKAEQYANELLKSVQGGAGSWDSGNAIFTGNIVLGRVSLRRGDIAGAKQHLLAAGETSGSPQLDSFGPSMTLAKELLEKGERDTVIAYLQSCAKFWDMGRENLKSWIATIKGGGTPDFGANLFY
jgi:tetratricopeptide (TPR) repeat protein